MRIIVFSVFLGLVGCDNSGEGVPGFSGPAELKVSGSETFIRAVFDKLEPEFEAAYPDIDLVVGGGGTGQGFQEIMRGETHLVAASREPTPSEQQGAVQRGFTLGEHAEHVLALDVVAVEAHPSKGLKELTYDQVIGIWCRGDITDWSQLGAKPGPIRVLSRDIYSGTRAVFDDYFCGLEGFQRNVEERDAASIAQIMRTDPNAIAYTSMTDIEGEVVALRPTSEQEAAFPSATAAIRGAYPLYRELYLYSAGAPSPLEATLLAWMTDRAGQRILTEAGFVAISRRLPLLGGERPVREIVYFEGGEEGLSDRSRARLDMLIEELAVLPEGDRHVILEGHADPYEAVPYETSQERAQLIREYLETEIDDGFYEVIPRGASEPLAPQKTLTSEDRNRRVHVYLASDERLRGVQAD